MIAQRFGSVRKFNSCRTKLACIEFTIVYTDPCILRCDHKVEEGMTNEDLNQQGTARKIQMKLNENKKKHWRS